MAGSQPKELFTMGTRSLTRFIDDNFRRPIAAVYRHWDGQPKGHGKELATILSKITVGMGARDDVMHTEYANGPDCMAATVIGQLKNCVGNVYMCHPSSTANDVNAEFTYTVYCQQQGATELVCLKVQAGRKVIFDGSAHHFYLSCIAGDFDKY
jgi:hypothetical protein